MGAHGASDSTERVATIGYDFLTSVGASVGAAYAASKRWFYETLLRAYRGVASFDGRYPRAWLLVIMRNTQKNRLRRRRPPLLHDPERALALVANSAVDAATPESIVDDRLLDDAIERSLAALPTNFRHAVQSVDIEGRNYAETAAALDIPMGTVMSRLHRGRKLLREHLDADPLFDARRYSSSETPPS